MGQILLSWPEFHPCWHLCCWCSLSGDGENSSFLTPDWGCSRLGCAGEDRTLGISQFSCRTLRSEQKWHRGRCPCPGAGGAPGSLPTQTILGLPALIRASVWSLKGESGCRSVRKIRDLHEEINGLCSLEKRFAVSPVTGRINWVSAPIQVLENMPWSCQRQAQNAQNRHLCSAKLSVICKLAFLLLTQMFAV